MLVLLPRVERSRRRVVLRCLRLELVRCLWVVDCWPAGSFGSK